MSFLNATQYCMIFFSNWQKIENQGVSLMMLNICLSSKEGKSHKGKLI